MKKIDLGQIVNTLANVGVIAGIAFLVVEIHQNNQLLTAQAEYNYLQNRADTSTRAVTNRDFAELLMKRDSGAPLSELDRYQLTRHAMETMLQWQWEYLQMTAGSLDEDIDRMGCNWGRGMRSNAQFYDDAYSTLKETLRPEFIDFIDRYLDEASCD